MSAMPLYALLHLTGYDLPMEELRNFRQWGAKTAGHPEYEPDLGIEMTTGPLGQGISSAVGMAVGKHKAVAVKPAGVARIVLETMTPQGFGHVGHAALCLAAPHGL